MATYTPQHIRTTFGDAVCDDEKLVNECLSLCHHFNLDPENLRWKLEALNFRPSATHSEISPVTLDSILALKAQMQRDLVKEKKAQPRATTVSANVNRLRMPAMFNRNVNLPGMSRQGVVPQVKKEEIQVAGPSRVVFSGPKQDEEAKKQRAYRYMFEKPLERSENLDQMIDNVAELVRNHYKLEEIGDPGTTTDEDVVIVGRIFQDPDVEPSKLTETSVFLESSRMLSGGARITLKFDPSLVIRNNIRGAKGLGLFPGAIVALRGVNGGGGYFLVKEILTLPIPSPESLTSGPHAMKLDPASSSPFALAIACGPFTADSDLDYTPWTGMIESLQKDKPTALLLVGPFIDVAHTSVQTGDLDSTAPVLFQRKIYKPLRTFLDASPGSIAILLPSVRDLASDHAVYPQSELSAELVNNDPRIHLVPNPARFDINGISFGACSVDVLFHLRKEEFVKHGREVDPILPAHEDDVGTDAMAGLCRHLLQQQSFYPIFPTPQELAHEVNLDISHSSRLRLVDGTDYPLPPDVLILPSKLKHFVKTVHNTTFVNPSFLNRGTYALLTATEDGGGLGVKPVKCEIHRLGQ